MLNRIIIFLFAAVILAATMGFVLSQSGADTEAVLVTKPFRTTIREVVVANGVIVPREEIRVKPQISGVIKALFVETGDRVEKGDLLAIVEPQPDPADVNEAMRKLREAELRAEFALREHKRGATIARKGGMTESELNKLELEVKVAQENLQAAKRMLEIVQTGTSVDLGRSASEVRATITGTILERPVELGTFVIETNTFNEGSTIVKIADMRELVFEGEIDEQDAGQLSVDMPLRVVIGAFPDAPMDARISTIAPQASQRNENGDAVQQITSFEIKADFVDDKSALALRSGYSATAEATLRSAENVIAIDERDLRFKQDVPYVLVKNTQGKLQEVVITTGLSDGLRIEVKSGLTLDADIVRNN